MTTHSSASFLHRESVCTLAEIRGVSCITYIFRVGPLFDCSLNPSVSCLEYFRRIFSRHFVPIGGQPMAAMRLRIWKLKKLLNVMGRQISPLPHDRGVGPGGLGRRAAGRERNR